MHGTCAGCEGDGKLPTADSAGQMDPAGRSQADHREAPWRQNVALGHLVAFWDPNQGHRMEPSEMFVGEHNPI